MELLRRYCGEIVGRVWEECGYCVGILCRECDESLGRLYLNIGNNFEQLLGVCG